MFTEAEVKGNIDVKVRQNSLFPKVQGELKSRIWFLEEYIYFRRFCRVCRFLRNLREIWPKHSRNNEKVTHVRKFWVFFLLGVKNAVLVSLRVFSLKMITAEAFAVFFRILSRKNMAEDNALYRNWYLLGEKKNSRHAHKNAIFLRNSFPNFRRVPSPGF